MWGSSYTAAPTQAPVHFMAITRGWWRDSALLFELGLVKREEQNCALIWALIFVWSCRGAGRELSGVTAMFSATKQCDKSGLLVRFFSFSWQTYVRGEQVRFWLAWQPDINCSVVRTYLTSFTSRTFHFYIFIRKCIKDGPQIRHFFPKDAGVLCSELAGMLQPTPPPSPSLQHQSITRAVWNSLKALD